MLGEEGLIKRQAFGALSKETEDKPLGKQKERTVRRMPPDYQFLSLLQAEGRPILTVVPLSTLGPSYKEAGLGVTLSQ